jgi:phosphoketolase
MKHHTAIPEIKYYIINIINGHQMYWSSDHQQEIDTTQNKQTPTLFTKDQ